MRAILNRPHSPASGRDLVEYRQLANPLLLTHDRRQGLLTAKCGKSIPLLNAPMILCVDDEPTGLSARRLLLSIAGYTVLTANNGDDALWLFSRNHVDLVITDHLLPDVAGVELMRQMKLLKPDIPIILFTGFVDPLPGFEQADQVLTKGGVTPPEFLAQIAAVLSRVEPVRAEAV
jgi:CheY-like chemotaxis protein